MIHATLREYWCTQLATRRLLTAIESFTSCGRLESFKAAEAAEANRTDEQFMRGARNAAHTRLEESRRAIRN